MKKTLLIAGITFLTLPRFALAVCPVCTIAVGAGIGLSRWLGIDDTVTGVWIGGLAVSITIWTINWLDKKRIRFHGRKMLVTVGYYALIILPLYWKGIVGHPYNILWSVDKLILGIILGSVLFFGGALNYNHLKKQRGKAKYPFQRVVMPIAPLVILSIIFYFITK